jgi:CubicO group peptidase (beta-lactamase class C family)
VHEPFDDYVALEIVRPLRMNDSGYFPRKLPASRLTVGYGSARGTDGRFTYTPSRAFWAHGPVGGSVLDHQFSCANYPSGMLHTSAEQYARLLMMVMNGGTLDGAQILKPASVDLMLTPSGFRNSWGYRQGLVFQSATDLDGHAVWGHDGQDRGASSAAFFNRETGVGALAFANANWADYQLSARLVDLDLHLISWFQ